MPYCTQEDIESSGIAPIRLIELTDDGNTGNIGDVVLDRIIEDSDAIIDTYLSGRYSLPLATVSPIIRRCSVDLSVYSLYTRRDVPTEQLATVRQRYTDTLTILQNLRDGKTHLPEAIERDAGTPVRTSSLATVVTPTAIFPKRVRDTLP